MKDLTKGCLYGLVVAALLLAPTVVWAGGCRVIVPVKKVYVVPVVAKFVPIVVPLYSAVGVPGSAYGAPPVPNGSAGPVPGAAVGGNPQGLNGNGVQPNGDGTQQQSADPMQQLLRALEQLNDRIDRLEGKPPRQQQPQQHHAPGQQQMPPAVGSNGGNGGFVTLASGKCARCHDKSAPQGGFAMFENGKLMNLTPEQLGSIVDQVTSKKMPKGGAMTDTERLTFVSALTRSGPTASR